MDLSLDLSKVLDLLDRTVNSKGTLNNILKEELRIAKTWIQTEFMKNEAEIARLKNQNKPSQPRSYRDIAANPGNVETNELKQIDPHCIVKIYPKRLNDGSMNLLSSEATKQYVKNIKIKSNCAVKNVKSIPGSGVSILCRSKEEATDLKTQLVTDESENLFIKQPMIRNPRFSMLLPGVEYTLDAVRDELLSRNQALEKDSFELTNMIKTKNGNTILYMNAKPNAYRLIRAQKNRLFAYWDCPTLRESLPTSQCFNCGLFGHNSKRCHFTIDMKKASKCLKCGDNHDHRRCTKTLNCSNCATRNKYNTHRTTEPFATDHAANDPKCPCFQKAMRDASSLIIYD